jgi:hypothetical protein
MGLGCYQDQIDSAIELVFSALQEALLIKILAVLKPQLRLQYCQINWIVEVLLGELRGDCGRDRIYMLIEEWRWRGCYFHRLDRCTGLTSSHEQQNQDWKPFVEPSQANLQEALSASRVQKASP